jgi:hypothetical protein
MSKMAPETNPFGTSENMNASLVSLLEDLDSNSNEFTSSLKICVSLSVDDGDQKLPAARPAVLLTATISSSWDDDNGGLNEINGMSRYRIPEERYEHLWLCAADATLIWCLWSDS